MTYTFASTNSTTTSPLVALSSWSSTIFMKVDSTSVPPTCPTFYNCCLCLTIKLCTIIVPSDYHFASEHHLFASISILS